MTSNLVVFEVTTRPLGRPAVKSEDTPLIFLNRFFEKSPQTTRGRGAAGDRHQGAGESPELRKESRTSSEEWEVGNSTVAASKSLVRVTKGHITRVRIKVACSYNICSPVRWHFSYLLPGINGYAMSSVFYVSQSATAYFVPIYLQDEESGRTLGVVTMSLDRRTV